MARRMDNTNIKQFKKPKRRHYRITKTGSRRAQLTMTMLQIGHTQLTHGNILNITTSKQCDPSSCDTFL